MVILVDVVDRSNVDPATEYAVYDIDLQCYMRDPYGYTGSWFAAVDCGGG